MPRKRDAGPTMAAAFLAESRDRPRTAELRFDAIGVTIDARAPVALSTGGASDDATVEGAS